MATVRDLLARCAGAAVLLGALQLACQGPDEFFRNSGGLSGTGGQPTATGAGGSNPGTGGTGTGGAVVGAGGSSVGAGGSSVGTGGHAAAGGVTGSTGGATGTGGVTGTGGAKGTGGAPSTGGTTGTGGATGIGGVTGTGGAGGAGGVMSTGGASGAGGSTSGTGPCAGLCDSPMAITSQTFSSGGLGTTAVCYVSMANIQGGNCYNFVAPRSLTVNGTPEPCTTSGNWTLPAKIAGGYCIVVSAGDYSYAGFTTF